MPGQPPRRILSLDGGGSWGALEVRALQELYGAGARGREVLGRFDLVAANSAGALILAALAEDLTLSEVAGIFASEAQRRRVFARGEGPAWLNPVRWAVGGPRYSTRRKAEGLAALLPRCGLPVTAPALGGASRWIDLMRVDKKAEGGEIRFVVVDEAGHAFVRPAPDALVAEVIAARCAA